MESSGWRSALDGVAALAILALGGCDSQPHFLADRTGQKAAHRMRLPASGFDQFLRRGAPGRFSRSRTLAVLLPSRAPAFAGLAFLGALAPFLAGVVFFPDLGFEDATCARRGASTGLFGGFRLLGRGRGLGRFLFFGSRVIVNSPSGGDYRGHDIDRSGREQKQGQFCGKVAMAKESRWRALHRATSENSRRRAGSMRSITSRLQRIEACFPRRPVRRPPSDADTQYWDAR